LIRSFFLKNKNFFKKNPDLLNKLNFPHTDIGSNHSLLERQNLKLKKKIKDYERKFSMLIDVADSNEKIYSNLIQWLMLSLKPQINSTNPKLFLKLLADNFAVKLASVLVLENNSENLEEFSEFVLNNNHPLEPKVKSQSKINFLQVSSLEAKKWLNFFEIKDDNFRLKKSDSELTKFSDISINFGSMAIVPLTNSERNHSLLGVLIMVSEETQKFQEGQGVLFLKSIAQILSSILISKLEIEEPLV
jgi:uncharacterized protein YigA (DUF484 family)